MAPLAELAWLSEVQLVQMMGLANAAGVIARAVATASKANTNFFIFTSLDRPRGHL
jgi:hypothetical protein